MQIETGFVSEKLLLRAVQSVQYFLENVLINLQNLIYATSIAFRSESNAHF